jgi:hypothetical protein
MDTLREILSDIDKDINVITRHIDNNYFRNFMETAYLASQRLPLPEGDAPYTPSKIETDVMTKGVIWQFLKKLNTLKRPELKPLKREMMFIDALETSTPAEAIVLVHMKDQILHKLYPNITFDNLVKVGYFTVNSM